MTIKTSYSNILKEESLHVSTQGSWKMLMTTNLKCKKVIGETTAVSLSFYSMKQVRGSTKPWD